MKIIHRSIHQRNAMKTSKIIFAIAAMGAAIAANAATLSYSLIENATSSKAGEVVSKGVLNINSNPVAITSGQFSSYIKEASRKPDEANPSGPKKLVLVPGEIFSGYHLHLEEVKDSVFAFSLKQEQLESLTKRSFSMDKIDGIDEIDGIDGIDEGEMYVQLPATTQKSSKQVRKLAIGEKAVIFTDVPVDGPGEAKKTGGVNHSLRLEVTRLD